jgi:hypothetical protein
VPIFEATLYRLGCAGLLARQAAEGSDIGPRELTEEWLLAALKKKKSGARFEDAEQMRARKQAELDDHVTRMLENHPQQFLNLWRHETALSRSLLRVLHELERLQAKRAGQHVPVPAIVDVDVSAPEPAGADVGGAGSGEPNANQH